MLLVETDYWKLAAGLYRGIEEVPVDESVIGLRLQKISRERPQAAPGERVFADVDAARPRFKLSPPAAAAEPFVLDVVLALIGRLLTPWARSALAP